MKEKQTVLVRVSYLVELTEEQLIGENNMRDKITGEFCKDNKIIIADENIEMEWVGTTSIMLNPQNANCGKCANCGQWVTDREKPDSIAGLCNGAEVDGKLLCDECLPSDHRWAF